MAQNEDQSSSFESSDSQPSATLVNEIWVPLLKCKSNYDAWRAKLEEAVSTKDPASWRILTGDLSDPFDHIDTILSRQSFARSGMAKRLKIDPACVTEEQVKDFLQKQSPVRGAYAHAVREEWTDKV